MKKDFLDRIARKLIETGSNWIQRNEQPQPDESPDKSKTHARPLTEDERRNRVALTHSQVSSFLRTAVRTEFDRYRDYLHKNWAENKDRTFAITVDAPPAEFAPIIATLDTLPAWQELQTLIKGHSFLANEMFQVLPFIPQRYYLDYSWYKTKTPIFDLRRYPVLVCAPPLLYGGEVKLPGSALLLHPDWVGESGPR